MFHFVTVPTVGYRRFVLLPLFILLVTLIGFELKTDTIPDALLRPAGLYLMIMAARNGPLRWWRYPLALASILLVLLMLAYGCRELLGWESLGGGAIKLMAIVGGSVGMAIGFETAAIWLLVVATAIVFTSFSALPSSPFVAVALYIALGRRYGFNFLFARTEQVQTVPANEPDELAIDATPAISSIPNDKQLPAFFRLPPTPTLLLQGGALLTFGCGFLSRQIQKVPEHSVLASLAIEGLRVASFAGIVCFIVGWVKTRKQN